MTEQLQVKQLENYSNYYIDESGTIISKNRGGLVMKPFLHSGHPSVAMVSDDGHRKQFYIHRLVAELFIDNPCKHRFVMRLDGDVNNNSKSNLRWSDGKEFREYVKRIRKWYR